MVPFIAQVVDEVITILIYAIVIRAFLSFIPQLRSNNVVKLLYDVTDPLLKPFRRFQIGGPAMALDFSPILAIIVLSIIQNVIGRLFG